MKRKWNEMMRGKGDEKCEDNYECERGARRKMKRSVTVSRTLANVSKIGKTFFFSSPKHNLI